MLSHNSSQIPPKGNIEEVPGWNLMIVRMGLGTSKVKNPKVFTLALQSGVTNLQWCVLRALLGLLQEKMYPR